MRVGMQAFKSETRVSERVRCSRWQRRRTNTSAFLTRVCGSSRARLCRLLRATGDVCYTDLEFEQISAYKLMKLRNTRLSLAVHAQPPFSCLPSPRTSIIISRPSITADKPGLATHSLVIASKSKQLSFKPASALVFLAIATLRPRVNTSTRVVA